MARIVEEIIAVRVSSLCRDGMEPTNTVFTDEVVNELEKVISEIVGNRLVEIIKD